MFGIVYNAIAQFYFVSCSNFLTLRGRTQKQRPLRKKKKKKNLITSISLPMHGNALSGM